MICSYIDIVAGLAVSNEGHIVAVDSVSPTVFVISEDGDLVHWFDCSDHMREPSDIAISGKNRTFLLLIHSIDTIRKKNAATDSHMMIAHLLRAFLIIVFTPIIIISFFISIGTDFYVCDFKGHCVAVFGQDGSFKYRIGGEKITCFPNGIDISDAGDILIGDSHGNRFHVACFSREGVLQSEFECPHVKVGFLTTLFVLHIC